MRRPISLLLLPIALLALVTASLLTGCGGGDSSEDVAALLSDTFGEGERVKSGKLDLTVDVDAAGLAGLPSPLRIDVNGPFQGMGTSRPPKFDFDLALKTRDGRVQIGAISTGKDSWMKLGTRAYTLRDGAFDALVESGKDDASGGLSTFGVDPRPWMEDPRVVGTEELDGERVIHLKAGVDVPGLIEDLGGLFGRAGGAAAGGGGTTGSDVSQQQREQIAESVTDASVDIWTGEEDRKLRRISVVVEVDTAEQQGGRIRLDLAVTQQDREQPIGPPANPRPLSELTAALAELGARANQGAASGEQDGPTGRSGAQETPLPENASAYDRCLDGAGEDIAAAQRCAELVGK